MSASRIKLQDTLSGYTKDTLTHIVTVDEFCAKFEKWMSRRKDEKAKMSDMKKRFDKINMKLCHVKKAKKKGKAFVDYIKSAVSPHTDRNNKELEKELGSVLKDTLEGLMELDRFSDAVEKLAVTSLHVFAEENTVLHLPKGIHHDDIKNVITAAQIICPLLIEFKRDASVFFLPRLENIEPLSSQLCIYILTAQAMCCALKKSNFNPKKKTMETVVDLNDLPEKEVQRMIEHIDQLHDIRLNQNFRMVFLFEEELRSSFIQKFNECHPRMLKFLEDLEGNALQLDKMNKGARISNVVGSSVGAVGGVLSIIGLALIPVTAGVSLALTMAGVGMGIGSGVNSLVTTATEMGVNRTQQKKASETFESFFKNVQVLQKCLEDAAFVQKHVKGEIKQESIVEMIIGLKTIVGSTAGVGKAIDSLVDSASAFSILRNEAAIADVGSGVAQEAGAIRSASRLASDLPDIGQAAVKGPLALSKAARAGFIALNGAFVGLDVFIICKNSISLAKGSETEFSKLLRARAALWSSEIDAWQKIHDSLCEGEPSAKKNQAILDKPFYPGLK